MYKLKEKCEDFIVKEEINLKLINQGTYCCFLLKKTNMNTMTVIDKIARYCGIHSADIGVCGIKDKNAVTYQHITIISRLKSKVESINIEGVELSFVGYLKDRLNLGSHNANYFEITVRNLEDDKYNDVKYMPNYFGEQRFSKNNVEIGKHLIKKEYLDAAPLIAESNMKVKESLDKCSSDPILAIKQLNPKIISIYVHAYQSYIFNTILANHIRKNDSESRDIKESFGTLCFSNKYTENKELILPGFDTEDEEILSIIHKDDIKIRDFINRQIVNLTCDETYRDAFVEIKNLNVGKVSCDELNAGKLKRTLSFTLPTGSFATIALRTLLY